MAAVVAAGGTTGRAMVFAGRGLFGLVRTQPSAYVSSAITWPFALSVPAGPVVPMGLGMRVSSL